MPSQATPSTYGGTITCPKSVTFSKVHGPAPAIGTAVVDGNVTGMFPLGSTKFIQLGPSTFVGFVNSLVYDKAEDVTTIQMTDWRDILHDHWFFGGFNIQEEDGRIWHVFHQDWRINAVTPVAKELDQFDFTGIQNSSSFNALRSVAKQKLVSAAEILNAIATVYGFSWIAEPIAYQILTKSRPMNMNFMSGAKIVDAIGSVLDACGLQFSVRAPGQIYITMKGFSSNVFSNALLHAGTSICVIDASAFSIGKEISEKGRKVLIVGKRNRHQFTFPCKPNWNPNWTWELCYGGWILSALLKKYNLTPEDKISKLPKKYHDKQVWQEQQDLSGQGHVNDKRTRMDLTIKEYIDKICFKIYIIDFRFVISKLKLAHLNTVDAKYVPFEKWVPTAKLNLQNTLSTQKSFSGTYTQTPVPIEHHTCAFPPSERLVTDSNLQFIALSTSRKIVNGIRNPFADQRTLVPMNEGVSLSVEDRIWPIQILEGKDGQKTIVSGDRSGVADDGYKTTKKVTTGYTIRLIFDEVRMWHNKTLPFTDPKSVLPDFVACVLSLDGAIFGYEKGFMLNAPKVRTQKVDVPNLHDATVNDHKVVVLADNYRKNLKDQGVAPAIVPARASSIAQKIANQILFHLPINTSGRASFDRVAGFQPDGLVDNVTVSFDDQSGFSEDVQLTDGFASGEKYSAPIQLALSERIKFEGRLVTDRLKQLVKMAAQAGKGRAAAMGNPNTIMQTPASIFNPAATSKAYSGGSAKQGTAKVKTKKDKITAETSGLSVSQVMAYGKIKEMSEADDS